MENATSLDAEYWLSWIISDYTPFNHDDKCFFMSNPSRDNRFLGEDLFLKYYRKALDEGCVSDIDIDKLLEKYGFWSKEKAKQLSTLIKDTETIKIKMYESYLNMDMVQKLRSALNGTNKLIEKLIIDKSFFDNNSAKSVALYCKQNFLIGCSIFKSKNKPYWRNPLNCWDSPDSILSSAYKALNQYNLTDTDYRELARSNNWKNIWNVRKGIGNIFGKSLVDLTVAQRHLLAWSNLYESVYNHSSPPIDLVIDDDDLLDGWMLFQKRKRDSELNKQALESRMNPRIMQSDEVFIMAGGEKYGASLTPDNFDIIYEMNDLQGKMAFKRRMAQISREGIVSESNMIETQEQIRMQATAMQKRR